MLALCLTRTTTYNAHLCQGLRAVRFTCHVKPIDSITRPYTCTLGVKQLALFLAKLQFYTLLVSLLVWNTYEIQHNFIPNYQVFHAIIQVNARLLKF